MLSRLRAHGGRLTVAIYAPTAELRPMLVDGVWHAADGHLKDTAPRLLMRQELVLMHPQQTEHSRGRWGQGEGSRGANLERGRETPQGLVRSRQRLPGRRVLPVGPQHQLQAGHSLCDRRRSCSSRGSNNDKGFLVPHDGGPESCP